MEAVMIDPKTQSMKVTIEFTYDTEIYDDDPTDVYELARLESRALDRAFEGPISSVVGDVRFLRVNIQPD